MTSQDVIQVVQVAQSLIAEVQALKGNAVSKTEMEGSNQALEGKIMKNMTLAVEGIIGSLVKALHAEIQGKVQGEIDTLKVAVTTLEQRDVAMQGDRIQCHGKDTAVGGRHGGIRRSASHSRDG